MYAIFVAFVTYSTLILCASFIFGFKLFLDYISEKIKEQKIEKIIKSKPSILICRDDNGHSYIINNYKISKDKSKIIDCHINMAFDVAKCDIPRK
jgi:uncharacterized protein YeeX (DUF496 family)